MEKWEQAARSFIDSCSFKDEIDAVFLTGSHAFGNADEFSDVDLFIVLSDDAKWRERGSKRVNGLRIEYFVNPVRQIIKYIEGSYTDARLIEITMILGGIVIYNKNSAAEKMIDYCKQKLVSEFPKMSEFNVKTGLYLLWDNLDELNRAYANKTPDVEMQFFMLIRSAFELYSRYICSPVPSYHKLFKWLTNEKYAKRYGLPVFNDTVFLEMIKSAFCCKDSKAMLELSDDIYAYVSDKMGGMDVDNFALRGPCE